MKRLLTLIVSLCVILSVCACSPDNILSPNPQQNDKAPNSIESNSTVKPEKSPEIPNKQEKNETIVPTINIDTLDYVKVKTSDLKNKELNMYLGDNAFSIGEISEREWVSEIAKKYGFKVNYSLTSDARLYSSQLIAQKTGQKLDLISTVISDIATTNTLMANSSNLLPETFSSDQNCPFSKKVFDISGGKVFSGKGNAKVLWYNKEIIEDEISDSWTVENFKKISTNLPDGKTLLDTKFFTEFASCGSEQITGYSSETGYYVKLENDQSKNSFKAFAEILNEKNMLATNETRFYKGNTAFVYSDMPIRRDMKVDWLPLPKVDAEGTNVISLTGSGLGISKTADPENVDAAFTFAMLWCARYTECREDIMMFDLGLTYERTEKYFHYAENAGNIYSADRVINDYLTFKNIPDFLYSDEQKEAIDSVTNPIPFIQKRIELINTRYQ